MDLTQRVERLEKLHAAQLAELELKPTFFKVGDLVKLVTPYGTSDSPAVGSIGVIRVVTDGSISYGVEWVGFRTGHDLYRGGDEKARDPKAGWYVYASNLAHA